MMMQSMQTNIVRKLNRDTKVWHKKNKVLQTNASDSIEAARVVILTQETMGLLGGTTYP